MDVKNQDTKTMNLRRIPMGLKEKDKTFEFLCNCSPTELRLYCVLQQESNWNKSENHRYIDYTDKPLKTFFDLAKISYKTGLSNIKKLEKRGLIELVSFKNFLGEDRKIIKLPTNENETYVLCNLDLDLYNILKGACKPVVIKVYIFHCFLGCYNSNNNFTYSCSLETIARNIGSSQTNLSNIIASNNLLQKLKVIDIWRECVDEEGLKYRNIYKFNSNKRCPSSKSDV